MTIKSDNFSQAKTFGKEMHQLIVKTVDKEMCQLLAIEQLWMLKKKNLHKKGSFHFNSKNTSNSKKIDYFLSFEDTPYQNS